MQLRVRSSTLHQILASTAAALAGFNSGMWRVWPSKAIPHLKSSKSDFLVTETDLSFIASLSYFTYFLTPFICKYLIRFGRKFCVICSLSLFVVTWTCALLASSPYVLYLASASAGFGNGLSSIVVPIYIAEVAGSKIRGTLTSGYILMFTLGQIFVASMGLQVSLHSLNVAGLVFSILSLGFASFFVRESPHHFLMTGEDEKAKISYQYFERNTEILASVSDLKVDIELEEMKQKIRSEMEASSAFSQLFRGKGNRRAALTICCVSTLQMLSGTTSIISFSSMTLPPSNTFLTPELTVLICLILGSLSNSLGSFLIDIVGRRVLVAVSSSVGALCTAAMAVFYFVHAKTLIDTTSYALVPYFLTMTYIAVFYLGMGIVRPVLIGELFPSNIKVHASMISIYCLSAASFFVNFIYLHMYSLFGIYSMFIIFSISNFYYFLASIFLLIETKGKSLFEIQEILKNL